MLKFQIIYILKFILCVLFFLKRKIYFFLKKKPKDVKTVEGIPISLMQKITAKREFNWVFDQKHRKKSYVKAFFSINKVAIIHHFAIIRIFYVNILRLKYSLKAFKVRFKYELKRIKLYPSFFFNFKSYIIDSIPENIKTFTYNLYDIFFNKERRIFTFRVKPKSKKINWNKKKKLKYNSNIDKSRFERDFVEGLVDLKKMHVINIKSDNFISGFDNLYFFNMLNLLVIKVQYQAGMFYKSTMDLFKQMFNFFILHPNTTKSTSPEINNKDIKGINMVVVELLVIFRSIIKNVMFLFKSTELVEIRFTHLIFWWRKFGHFDKLIEKYPVNFFLHKDLAFNIHHFIFWLFYINPNYNNKQIPSKTPYNIWSKFVIRNNNSIVIKTFNQGLRFFYDQEEDAYWSRFDYFKYSSYSDKELIFPLKSQLKFTFNMKEDFEPAQFRKVHYKLVYGWHLLNEYFTISPKQAERFYRYVGLQDKNNKWHLEAGLLNLMNVRSWSSKFVKLYYKIYNFQYVWYPYNSLLSFINTNLYNKQQMYDFHNIWHKIKVMFVIDIDDYTGLPIRSREKFIDFFQIKKKRELKPLNFTRREYIYFFIDFFRWYGWWLFNLYKIENLEVHFSKWSLLYKLSKRNNVKTFNIEKFIKNLSKIGNIVDLISSKVTITSTILDRLPSFNIYRCIYLINKYILESRIVELYEELKYKIYWYWQNLKRH